MKNSKQNGIGLRKQSFLKRFQKRFFLRFHMSLILIATVLFGLLSSKLLLMIHLDNIVIRYPLAALFSYLAFFVMIKMWLWCISSARPFEGSETIGDFVPNIPSSFSGSPSSDAPGFGGGLGGRSGGGGATSAFDGPVSSIQPVVLPSSSGDTGSSCGIVDAVGDVTSGIDDEGIILIVLGVLIAVIFGSSLYLIYEAPHILSDAAFNFLLATSLIRSYRTMNKPDWIGSVFRTTYIPFIIVAIISFVAAWIIHAHCPEVSKISDLVPFFQ